MYSRVKVDLFKNKALKLGDIAELAFIPALVINMEVAKTDADFLAIY